MIDVIMTKFFTLCFKMAESFEKSDNILQDSEKYKYNGFTVIMPQRYKAPDMMPPAIRRREQGIFTTRLKNEAAYINVVIIMVFILNLTVVMSCSWGASFPGRYILGAS